VIVEISSEVALSMVRLPLYTMYFATHKILWKMVLDFVNVL